MISTSNKRYADALQYVELFEEPRGRDSKIDSETQQRKCIFIEFQRTSLHLSSRMIPIQNRAVQNINQSVVRPLSAFESRRIRTIERLNKKESQSEVISGIKRLSRPSTALPTNRFLELSEQQALSDRRKKFINATMEAYLQNEERMMLRSYRNLWEESLHNLQDVIFVDGVANADWSGYLSNALAHLTHAVICIRSRELKEQLRRELPRVEHPNPKYRVVRKSGLVLMPSLLGATIWDTTRKLTTNPTPKNVQRILRCAALPLSHFQNLVTSSTISLHQAATLLRFRYLVVRIQSIFRSYVTRKRFVAQRQQAKLIQRVGAGYLDRKMYICRRNKMKQILKEESILQKWRSSTEVMHSEL